MHNTAVFYALQTVVVVWQQSVPSAMRMELVCVLTEPLVKNVMNVALNTQVQITVWLITVYLYVQHR